MTDKHTEINGRSDEQAPDQSDRAMSLDELTEAFRVMLTSNRDDTAQQDQAHSDASESWDDESAELSPRAILEAMLFVGSPENRPLDRHQAAAMLRGVRPQDIDELVRALNAKYAEDGTPYEIVDRGGGYLMVLKRAYQRVRDKFYGRARQARLSQAAIDVLSVVAYNQPVTADQISQLRNLASGPMLSQLVRRRLLRVERPQQKPRTPLYYTTDRFLRLFGLEKLDDLPRGEDSTSPQ